MLATRRYITKEFWQLPLSSASFATRPSWSNKDVDVVPVELRRWGPLLFTAFWAAFSGSVNSLQAAGAVFALGLGFKRTCVAIAIGQTLSGVTIGINGYVGSRYHVPFAVASRASLGFYFSYFAVCSRLILGLIYYGQNCFIAAQCMEIMLIAIWPSFASYPNTIPAKYGITSSLMISYFVLWALQLPLTLIHPSRLRWLFITKSVVSVCCVSGLLGWSIHSSKNPRILFSVPPKFSGSQLAWLFVKGTALPVSSVTTLALNIPDLTRYAKRPSTTWYQIIAIPCILTIFSLCGVIISSCSLDIYGEQFWNPLLFIPRWPNRAGKFFIGLGFCYATICTNITSNSVATSNDLAFLLPRWVNLRRGALITALLGGWVTQPWYLLASAEALNTFFSGYTIVMAPIVAVMIADTWIVHRTKLNVPAMYQNEGIYRYTYGINWRSLCTLLVVIPINLPGLAKALNPKISVSHGYQNFYMASWYTAFFFSLVLYSFLSLVFPARSTFMTEVVETLDEPQEVVEEKDGSETKDAKELVRVDSV